ncbi:ARM repeat-containing protein [Auriculariales sp. MPI-PUGE-AT-0066]|nr:ARM repeat-containing protein [Auriculariales sp. MPI-PUGE-AT-0066]
MAAAHQATIQSIAAALQVFSGAPSKDALEQANTWLQEFQHSTDAWTVCNLVLADPAQPEPARIFAAQTFRAKVIYDLNQLDATLLIPLRDTLITALRSYATGPRRIIVQLCLALSAFALQVAQWENPVQDMITQFGQDPALVPALLEFLQVLPEEVMDSHKIPITNDFFKERSNVLLSAKSQPVLDLLTMYIQAAGITAPLQSQIMLTVRSWVAAGEILAIDVARTPIFDFAFNALDSDPLFDAAVEMICDVIHETQENTENMSVIERIVPRLIALRPRLTEHREDSDRMRGYTRVFTEAGETYRALLLEHTETFYPLVEAIAECTACSDLDVVPITFPFWYRLAQSLGKRSAMPPTFTQAYAALVDIIIRHLHFPTDWESLTAQERDDFRSFRHHMGDTLKDCCYVLGSDVCLLRAFDLLTAALTRSTAGAVLWQEIEAPLFSMRSMGGQLDAHDDRVIPQIIDLIPQLPAHSRIRYSATMFISRYTEWLTNHAAYIPGLMTYVSSGFDDPDPEVSAASSQAIFYMCKDCPSHLVTFVPTLHQFIKTVGPKLAQEDLTQIYEAIGHVLVTLPMEDCARWVKTFALEVLQDVHAIAIRAIPAIKTELSAITSGLERLEAMLHVVRSFGDTLPQACQGTCPELWAMFDAFLLKYGGHFPVADATSRVLRQGLNLFQDGVLPVVPSALNRMTACFESTQFACYLWMVAKIITAFGNEEAADFRTLFKDSFNRCSASIVALLLASSSREHVDVLEDYVHLAFQLSDCAPDALYTVPGLSAAFHGAVEVLAVSKSDDAIGSALYFFRAVFYHDALRLDSALSSAPGTPAGTPGPIPPKWPEYALAIRAAFAEQHVRLLQALLSGVVDDFPNESLHTIGTLLRAMATIWPTELAQALPVAVDAISSKSLARESKAAFLTQIGTALTSGGQQEIKSALQLLVRESRKTRDRRNGFSVPDGNRY